MPGRIHDNVEHRLQRIRRTADDLQYIGCRGLELQRFAQVLGAFLDLLEQPDIADGDYRLIGKSLQQGNLFVRERIYFKTAKRDRSDALAFAQQGHAQNGPVTSNARHPLRFRKFGGFSGVRVVNVNREARSLRCSRLRAARARSKWSGYLECETSVALPEIRRLQRSARRECEPLPGR